MGECEAADKLIAKLPIDRDSDEEKEQRKTMFKEFDPNGNGYLSYSEASLSLYLNSNFGPSFENDSPCRVQRFEMQVPSRNLDWNQDADRFC